MLSHFSSMLQFYSPWKRQKIKGFLAFLWGMEKEYWAKIG